MAKFQKKKIQDTDNSGFGQYKEGVGGGASPQPMKPGTHGHGVNSDYRQANNDSSQARTSDGKFTYKSVNGESINPKYGPSRGKTVNPLLTGGKNGVKISDVEQEFSSQSGAIWDKYKDKWYQKGSEYMLISQGKGHKADYSTRVAAQPIWEVARKRYDVKKGEFEGESKVFEQSKKGKLGKEEAAAKQLAQASGQEQAVIDTNTGAIKVKPGTVQNFPAQPSPSQGAKPSQTVAPSPSVGGMPKGAEIPAVKSQLNHTKEQLDSARQLLSGAGVDTSGFTDEQLDQIVDDYIDFSDDSDSDKETEDDEATKTVKKLGFEE